MKVVSIASANPILYLVEPRQRAVKDTDETPLGENESELTDEEIQRAIRFLIKRVGSIDKWIHSEIPKINRLEAEVADLHHRRRISRQQAVDQDPEWH